MKWIRLRNTGDLDFPTMLSLFGASVKIREDAIGRFGNGSRYSFALACRLGIPIKVLTSGKTYTMCTAQEQFRGKDFDVVCFKTKTGSIVRSPITTELGQHDWTDIWFIFREFYSNMLDEGGTAELIDGIGEPEDGFVDVYLPYNEFSKYFDNVRDYFNTSHYEGLEVGTGRVYKKGVYVGTIPDLKLDLWTNDVKITESRTMNLESVYDCLAVALSNTTEVSSKSTIIYKNFFKSPGATNVNLWSWSSIEENIHNGLEAAHGSNYMICPSVPQIIEMCMSEGYHPVILSDKWGFGSNKKVKRYLDMVKDIGTRALNEIEQVLVDSVFKSIEFITDGKTFPVRVITDISLSRLGDANLQTKEIRIAESTLLDKPLLIEVLIHEATHCLTGKSDFDRGFVDFFVKKLAKLCS